MFPSGIIHTCNDSAPHKFGGSDESIFTARTNIVDRRERAEEFRYKRFVTELIQGLPSQFKLEISQSSRDG
jgi:hypothetical protein